MTSKSRKTSRKPEQSDVSSASINNATSANMLAMLELREDLLTGPNLLAVQFENKVTVIDSKLDRMQTMVTDHEQRISALESGTDQLKTLESTLTTLASDNAKLKTKLTNMKGSSRRYNLRLSGVPEAIKGPRPTCVLFRTLNFMVGQFCSSFEAASCLLAYKFIRCISLCVFMFFDAALGSFHRWVCFDLHTDGFQLPC